jgi:hypothetical protein
VPATIDWGTIGELLWAAPATAIVVSLAFALLILASARADDARRQGAAGAAAVYGTLALAAGLAFFAMVAFAISVIASK